MLLLYPGELYRLLGASSYFIDFAMYENTNFGAHESKQFPETTKIESTNISTFTINVYFYENESALYIK
jgi:hypothetical protein